MNSAKEKCLRCGRVLPDGQTLIDLECYERHVPLGLKRDWQNARGPESRRKVLRRVREFIQSLNAVSPFVPPPVSPELENDLALGEALVSGESANRSVPEDARPHLDPLPRGEEKTNEEYARANALAVGQQKPRW